MAPGAVQIRFAADQPVHRHIDVAGRCRDAVEAIPRAFYLQATVDADRLGWEAVHSEYGHRVREIRILNMEVEVGPDGAFTANTLPGRVGMMPGNYKVLVEYYDLKPGGNPKLESAFLLNEFFAEPLELKAGQDAVELTINVPKQKT